MSVGKLLSVSLAQVAAIVASASAIVHIALGGDLAIVTQVGLVVVVAMQAIVILTMKVDNERRQQ